MFTFADIESVAVSSKCRGRGYGKELMTAMIEAAKKMNVHHIQLTFNPGRVAANRLYQELGFERYETNCYKLKGYREFSFEGLEVYQAARLLVWDIYRLQQKFPKTEIYAIGDEIRRSASSVNSNIAEGSGRNSNKEKVHFIEIAYGSLMEAFSQLQIAQDLGYLT